MTIVQHSSSKVSKLSFSEGGVEELTEVNVKNICSQVLNSFYACLFLQIQMPLSPSMQ